MAWIASSRRLPGAHCTQPFSRFAALDAAQAALVSGVAPGPAAGGPPPAVVPLGGTWSRGTTTALARTRSVEYEPPSAGIAWQAVEVPDQYGLDPDLRQYFGPVWYRRSITRPPGDHVDLAFGAVDYLADVVLDGERLGRHEGYFAPFLFDVSDRLDAGRTSELLVRVQDPLEALPDRRLFTRHRKRWIKGVMNYHDSRPGGMPGSMTPGWTFELGQSSPTGGLIGPVALEPSGPVRLDGVFVTPLDLDGTVHACLAGINRTSAALAATAILTLVSPRGRATTQHVELEIPAGAIRVDLETVIEDPVLWWDAAAPERGGQPLYTLQVTLVVDGRASAGRTATFGLRIAEFPSDPRWHYVLNGVPVFMRAVNYIPTQHWARLDDAFYARDFELMKAAHLHSAGVHAHVQAPACYRAADRAGISLVQDFPLQWSYASGTEEDPTFVPRATAMAAEMAYLLWNHPSVVAYTAHNEPIHVLRSLVSAGIAARAKNASPLGRTALALATPLVQRMLAPMRDPDDARFDSGNRCLDRRLAGTMRAVDPTRFVHEASGAGHDTHDYSGTIGGGSVYDVGAVRAPFVSEYGSFPVTRRALGRHDAWATPWPPGRPQVRELCRQGLIATEVLGAAGDPGLYADLGAFATALERKAAFVAQYQTEFFRIHRHAPYTGCRWHFFVNHWGYMGGGLLNVDRVPTLAYHALAAALRPRLAAPRLRQTVWPAGLLAIPVFAMNDRQEPWQAVVTCRLERLAACDVIRGGRSTHAPRMMPPPSGTYVLSDGDAPDNNGVIAESKFEGTCNPNDTVAVGTVTVDLQPGPYRLVLEWTDGSSVERNAWSLLVTRRGWKAPIGLTRVAAADVG